MSDIQRYRLIAYVCDGGVTHERLEMGYSSYGTIVRNNPGCRFAVVETVGEVWAFDLHTTGWSAAFDPTPGEHRVFPTTDAAIAGCILSDHNKH